VKEKATYIVLTSATVTGVAAAALAGAAVAQDAAAGQASFAKCQACHAVGPGAKNKLGPELNGLAGRQAGAAAGVSVLARFEERRFHLGSVNLRRFHAKSENKSSWKQDGVRGHEGSKQDCEVMGISFALQCRR
jgi:cytochrome c2